MSGYHWLLLKDGRLAIGTKDDPMGRISWAVLMPNGTMQALAVQETATFSGEII